MIGGWVKLYAGQHDAAAESFARAMRLSPLDPLFFGMLTGTALSHFFSHRFDEAVRWARLAIAEKSEFVDPYRALAAASAHLGHDKEARFAMAQLLERYPHFTLSRARALMPYGRREDVELLLEGYRKAGLPEE